MDGLLVVDKPRGFTSHDVVSRIRRITGERSVGHLGTLDPLATGVLPLLLGRYTRLSQFFSAAEKEYTGEIYFGFATDTYDADGEPLGAPTPLTASLDEIRAAAARYHGTIQQTPPAFSAKKIAGVPAHRIARKGGQPELRAVSIDVKRFDLLSLNGDVAEFSAVVSSGGYIRSLAHDLGHALGCGAHLKSLRRVRSGDFTLAVAHSLDALSELSDRSALDQAIIPARQLLPELPSVTVTPEIAGQLRNGMTANLADFSNAQRVKAFSGGNELVAIARRVAGTLFAPQVVLRVS
jgi:tRNA pseudouridine55 synthase